MSKVYSTNYGSFDVYNKLEVRCAYCNSGLKFTLEDHDMVSKADGRERATIFVSSTCHCRRSAPTNAQGRRVCRVCQGPIGNNSAEDGLCWDCQTDVWSLTRVLSRIKGEDHD